MSEITTPATIDAISERILLRQRMLEIADRLQADGEAMAAVERLREAADADAAELDEGDIEIDFDASAPERDFAGLAALFGAGKPKAAATDPVEVALLTAIKIRDRRSALAIVGDTASPDDLKSYEDALLRLRDALNAAFPDED